MNAVWASACYDTMRAWRADCAKQRMVVTIDEARFKRAFGDIVALRYELELIPLLHSLARMERALAKLHLASVPLR